MPAAIPAVIAAASAAAAGTTIFGLSVALSATLIGIGSFALNTLGAMLSPKPKKQSFGDLSSSRTQQVKQPVTERRVIYGECKVSGPINYFGSTEDNKFLHIVLTLATHESKALGTTWFNDDAIHPDDLDANGNVTAGKHAGKARIKKHLGGTGQIVDPDLLAEITEITDAFVGNQITYIYARLEKDDQLYKSGLPNIQQWVQGALVLDSRTGTSYWTPNAGLCLRDYMVNTKYGVSTRANKFTDTNVTAVANSCEEMVATKPLIHTCTAVDAANNILTLNADLLKFQTGDRVQVTTEGTLPAGISAATNYFVIQWQQVGTVKIKLASSYANALVGTPIDITDAGAGNHTVTKNAEPRYTTNGTLGTGSTPRDNISNLLSAMAGDLLPVGGKWVMKAGVWVAPTITIDEDDLCGSIEIQTKHSRRERFNAVQGLYVTPVNLGEPGDYPLVKDATYITEDGGGQPIIAQLDLPFTSRSQTAQRVARVQLNRHRRQRTVQITTNLVGMQLQSGDTFRLTHANHNYNQKTFEVSDFNLVPRTDKNGKPILTCDLVCSETDSAIYDFDELTQELTPQPPQTVTFGNPDNVTPPGSPSVLEVKYVTTDGTGVKVRGDVSFSASTDFFVRQYQVEWKQQADTVYNVLPPATSLTQSIFDLTPGVYDVRVKAISIFDASSDYVSTTCTIIGLQDLPGDVQDFSVISLSDNATVAWTQTVDIDVRVSGWVRIRHTPDLIGYNWADARDITPALPGIATQANVPLLDGVYMAKFVDSVGNESATAAIIFVTNTQIINMNALLTLTQDPAFSGTKTNMIAVDNLLRFDGNVLFDSVAGLFDAALGAFDGGSGAGQQTSGVYEFATKGDVGKVARVYVSSHMLLQIYNSTDLFDSREGDFDEAIGLFDGNALPGVDIALFVRTTDTDPNGVSPTWTEWQPFVAGYFTARGFDFKLTAESIDASYQVDIEELEVSIDVPDVIDSGNITTLAGSLQTFAFNQTFTAAPDVVCIINDAQAGDQLVVPAANVTSSNFQAGVLNSGSYVIRNLVWFARGY